MSSISLDATSPLTVCISRTTAEEATRQDRPFFGQATGHSEVSSSRRRRTGARCYFHNLGRVCGGYGDGRRRSGDCSSSVAIVGCFEANGAPAPRPRGQQPLPQDFFLHLLLELSPRSTPFNK